MNHTGGAGPYGTDSTGGRSRNSKVSTKEGKNVVADRHSVVSFWRRRRILRLWPVGFPRWRGHRRGYDSADSACGVHVRDLPLNSTAGWAGSCDAADNGSVRTLGFARRQSITYSIQLLGAWLEVLFVRN